MHASKEQSADVSNKTTTQSNNSRRAGSSTSGIIPKQNYIFKMDVG